VTPLTVFTHRQRWIEPLMQINLL